MSAGELRACLEGLLLSGGDKMVPPDNRCCFCLTLRLGAIIIGLINFVLYLFAFSWYIGTVGFSGDFDAQVSNMDISVLVLFCVQLMVNLLLIVGAVKKIPLHIFPWLCSNAVVIAIIMVMIFMLVFFGASKNELSYNEYVTSLSLLSLLAGTDMFCCIVVFQFRRNLILESRIQTEESGDRHQGFQPRCSAPPAYEDASPGSKVPLEEPPPEYEAALAMLRPGDDPASSPAHGTHLRRKSSLTNKHV